MRKIIFFFCMTLSLQIYAQSDHKITTGVIAYLQGDYDKAFNSLNEGLKDIKTLKEKNISKGFYYRAKCYIINAHRINVIDNEVDIIKYVDILEKGYNDLLNAQKYDTENKWQEEVSNELRILYNALGGAYNELANINYNKANKDKGNEYLKQAYFYIKKLNVLTPEDSKTTALLKQIATKLNFTGDYKKFEDQEKELLDKRINEHINDLYNSDFSIRSINSYTFKELKYLDGNRKTITWKDIICGNSERIKKAVIEDINNFLLEKGYSIKGESYLKDWGNIVSNKKSKYIIEANEVVNWARDYPDSDAGALSIFKRDIGGSPIKVSFKPTVVTYSFKYKEGIAFFPKDPGCEYYPYVKFKIVQKALGSAVYDSPYGSTDTFGYTKKF